MNDDDIGTSSYRKEQFQNFLSPLWKTGDNMSMLQLWLKLKLMDIHVHSGTTNTDMNAKMIFFVGFQLSNTNKFWKENLLSCWALRFSWPLKFNWGVTRWDNKVLIPIQTILVLRDYPKQWHMSVPTLLYRIFYFDLIETSSNYTIVFNCKDWKYKKTHLSCLFIIWHNNMVIHSRKYGADVGG